ncbi:PREDICTED: HEAT repeat-containing protein 6-like [Amphimedon queenslandica]|uniref:Uncharacterized protein n=1 Tax=Amphimedon queenslandica TaxID=400682 RepID=A0AAN0K3X2_AMPQE|nr:PREDICTED: HEAT repeat-containing protein 6-like [Amphimedon queenslandica]|eukprot:XP_019863994.1 PREDICTED: HEAT repeat-containing protein 6-like [Amphimedon queenslandica]
MGRLSVETKTHILPLLLNLSKDSNPSIKSSAIRTLGIFSQYSSQCFTDTFILDACVGITNGLDLKQVVAVRIQASWSVGNMTDSLIHDEGWKDKVPLLYESVVVAIEGTEEVKVNALLALYKSVLVAMEDIEKVKVNAFRAAGNLLHVLTDEIYMYLKCEHGVIEKICSKLAKYINVGIMKGRVECLLCLL